MHPADPARARTRLWRVVPGFAAVCTVASALAATPPPQPPPSPPPPPRRIPELYVRFECTDPARRELDVQGRIQHATPESLDLVRWNPAAARLPRLEVLLGAEGFIAHPHSVQPEAYRSLVPRGAPLEYHYVLSPARGDSFPQVWGAEYACLWLGSTLLAPRFPADHARVAGAPAVERLLIGAALPLQWKLWAPWPQHAGLAHPADLDDATDNFIGFGMWRSHTEIVRGAPACTLTTSIAGAFTAADSSWAWLAREIILPQLPERSRGRAWVGIAPGSTPRVWIARRSALITCAVDSLPSRSWPVRSMRRTRHP